MRPEIPTDPPAGWTRRDIRQLAATVGLTLLFVARGGEPAGAVRQTLWNLFLCLFYGVGTMFLLVGLTRKMFKYEVTPPRMAKWAAWLAAFFAVSQFLHEGFLHLTGQLPR
ncbi:hypothetical protein G3N55_11330 [Dissulfurirhabdus thermomarina]|uniref:Uncharacterized protein n=1 Tax=Dissulfurirhabdus thermomarina TaxID=1765737 RepID=A0A6N9TSQ1_DISTH|nr:hypothetical protein [Dissulfurirhabdus thermomarina]NDY43430.1 hypothetical protein [Dissulfurirhabdus thermomarina]NMX23523.1 hypothetical protein [Dissulfurirhabdus thermomarina]